ncbi:protoheme IX farnesyltransferase [Rhodospirillaceae bacterium KN72]|uniref:Protoheme IX farnesyltransferase n=2 Tax=Pacificispira spongiicola TaxID=2729598 RepID=A0A7Y0DY31_9PROT|nr:protoheme IX farnesyltransferase [Pacificispira spongiicola]
MESGGFVRTSGMAGSKGAEVRDFISLLKPRVMSLVVFSGFAGMIMAPGSIHPVLAAVAVLCIAVGAGASGAINMWYDRDIDAVMSRTRGRPIPRGRVAPDDALAFGSILASGSVFLMVLAVNYVAAAILAITILFYVFVYTMWLKRSTPQNIVIGGAAGAFPPMIGWAAVTGGVSVESLLLFALIFFWTPPHFWALALYRRGDYEKAGVPMLPVVAGARATKLQMLIYTVLLLPLAVAPYFLGMTGQLYLMAAAVLGGLFLMSAIAVWFDETDKSAKRMFAFSIFYLFALFGAMILDRAPGAL